MLKNYKIITLLGLFVVLLSGCSKVSYLDAKDLNDDATNVVKENDESNLDDSDLEDSLIYVQVAGAVANPGVYQLPAGSRVFRVIEMAGGLLTSADDNDLNQASILTDGQKIRVYFVGERELSEETVDDGLIDINRATVEQLCKLPTIGESKAKLIISYRESNGLFASTEDIMKVQGIKEGTFAQIKELIKI